MSWKRATPGALAMLTKQTEHELQAQVIAYLDLCLCPSWRVRAGLEGLVVKSKAARRKAKEAGRKPGWPDLHFISGTGQAFVELKTATGRMRPAQSAFQVWCKEQGIPHAVCRSLDEVLARLNEWGIPMRRVQ